MILFEIVREGIIHKNVKKAKTSFEFTLKVHLAGHIGEESPALSAWQPQPS